MLNSKNFKRVMLMAENNNQNETKDHLNPESQTEFSQQDQEKAEENLGFAAAYVIELLYKEKPQISRKDFYAKIEKYTGHFNIESESEDSMHFFHLNYPVNLCNIETYARTFIATKKEQRYDREKYASALQQLWAWPEAESTLEECRYSLLLCDFLSSTLPYKERLNLISGVLRGLLEVAPCQALYWVNSEKLVEPQLYLELLTQGQLLHGAVNVRLFNVERNVMERKEIIMDSMGLAALGVPDVQCHFHSLDCNEVAKVLHYAIDFIFENGDIIADGETFGADEHQRWICCHEFSLVAPRRVVLDIKPEQEYYAG